MSLEYTRKHYCGHWSDDDLARQLAHLRLRLLSVRRELSELERDVGWVEEERAERKRRQMEAMEAVMREDDGVLRALAAHDRGE